MKRQKFDISETTIILGIIWIFFISVMIQGGFFPVCIALVGIAECILCFFVKVQPNPKYLCPILVFSLWYLFCSIKTGVVIEYTANALLPFAVMIFFFILTSIEIDARKRVLIYVIKISIVLAIISIGLCVYSSISNRITERALFPFQYSNACGIYFSVMIILSKQSKDKFIHRCRYIFYIALLLTQSVGAIILTVMGEIAYDFKVKKICIMLLGIAVFVICFHSRIYQSIGTFTERLLQIQDGIICIIRNPILGIGMGKWGEMKNIYQSGFYEATLIHSGIIQIGVDSGIVGMVLFIICIINAINKNLLKSKKHCICMGMFLTHSLMDCTMSFLGLDILFILILSQCIENTDLQATQRKLITIPCIIIVLLTFMTAEYCLLKIRNINKLFNKQEYSTVISNYENDNILPFSIGSQLDYVKSLYNTEQHDKTINVIDNFQYKTTDMLILRAWNSNYDFLIDALQTEKYNQKIYDEIREGANEDIQKKAAGIFNQAVDEMSILGTKLYNRMEK